MSDGTVLATEELFREDARLTECEARVVAIDARGVRLDRTVFYPQGGGQAGDAGELRARRRHAHRDRRHAQGRARPATIVHVPAAGPGGAARALRPGEPVTRAHRLGAAPPPHALPYRDAPAVRAGAASGQRLLDHARLRAARFPHDRAARQGGADGRHRAARRRGASGAAPLDHRRRARREPGARAQHERAAAARHRPRARCSRSRASTCSPAAARTWPTRPRSAPWSSRRSRRNRR